MYRKKSSYTKSADGSVRMQTEKHAFEPQIKDNLAHIRSLIGQSPDITIREFSYGSAQLAVVYTDGISDKTMVNAFILKVLLKNRTSEEMKETETGEALFDRVKADGTAVGEIGIAEVWDAAILSILSGDTVILVEGCAKALVCGTRGGKSRAISEPTSQVVIRGPKEGFTESIGVNVAQVRRRIRSPHLWLETLQIGSLTHTDVAVMYIQGLVDDAILQEVKRRLQKINIDSILETGYIEQLIQDETYTPFPILFNTERPDSVSGNLLEGRIAIFVDGTPFVLVTPATFVMFFQAAEDYYQNFEAASLIRMLRFGAYLISIFAPSIFIAAITFHQEMIPTQLVISLASQRQNVPFPAFVEALLMEGSFEILREAGLRMPRAIGQAVSIVGALVLGQAAVEAGIISPAMVIVVAITGISSFAAASYELALSARLIRFSMMMVAAFLGFFGIVTFSIVILGHMCGLRSFGVPYMASFAPFRLADQKDTFIRFPWRKLLTRPSFLELDNKQRQADSKQDAGKESP